MNPRDFEKNPPISDPAYEAGIDLESQVQNLAGYIFLQSLFDNGSILEALGEVCQSPRYALRLDDVLLADEAEVGRRIKVAVLRWLAHNSDVLARRRVRV